MLLSTKISHYKDELNNLCEQMAVESWHKYHFVQNKTSRRLRKISHGEKLHFLIVFS